TRSTPSFLCRTTWPTLCTSWGACAARPSAFTAPAPGQDGNAAVENAKSPPSGNGKRTQTAEKVPSSRHVRMDGTHTGKLSAESVRAALRRVRGSALNFVPRGILGGRNFCPAYAGRNGFPLKRGAFATRCQNRSLCVPVRVRYKN